MPEPTDWRDTFCGRVHELEQLIGLYEEVATGRGPRIAVVLGDRGMGKTRLVQELYRLLSTRHDPADYWPDASLFFGNNLRVAPDLADPAVRAHFQSFRVQDRPMPFLWWGLRLADPDVRNAVRSDMAAHRATLDPHLGPVLFARQIAGARARLKEAGADAATEFGKGLLKAAVNAIPGVGAAATMVDLLLDYADKGKKAAAAAHEELRLRQAADGMNPTHLELQRGNDIHERTLSDLAEVLATIEGRGTVPVVVFCDDAQFARAGGDEGALRLLTNLWQRAHLADWPLLLVLTHWAVDWHTAADGDKPDSCARQLGRDARSAQFGLVIDLPKEAALSRLVQAGLPDLPAPDTTLLLGKADGNPQVLIELIDLVREAPAWRREADGALTPFARQEIERRATDLSALILERLQRPSTPLAVRQAVALSSVQGMEFLCRLTAAAAETLELPDAAQALGLAEQPHRLVVNVQDGVANFVQRAYREASQQLLGRYVGDPANIEQQLLLVTIALVDDTDSWAGLGRKAQQAGLGVLAGLADEHPDAVTRRRAGAALLQLVRMALEGQNGADLARAAELASRFETGREQGLWQFEDFAIWEIRTAIQALTTWYGAAASRALAQAQLDWARTLCVSVATPEAQRNLYIALYDMGAVAQVQGDLSQAAAIYRESLQICRNLAGLLRTAEARRDLAVSLAAVGAVARAQSDWPLATAVYRESEQIVRDLAGRLGTPKARRDLSVSLDNTGAVAQAQSNWPVAEALYRESLQIRRDLARQLGTPEARRDLSISLNNVGFVAQAQGDWKQADAIYRESLQICRDLASLLGTPASRRDISVSLNNIGAVARAQGDWAQADVVYRESLQIRRELASLLGTPEARSDLATSLANIGAVAQTRGDWAQADAVYGESLQIGRELARLLQTPESRRNLAISLANVGAVAQAHGDWPQAGIVSRECLQICRELASLLSTPDARRDLANALGRVGAVAQAQGDWPGAEAIYSESLQIRRELARLLDTPEAHRDLSISLDNVGTVARANGDWTQADIVFRESLQICRNLASLLGTPEARRDLSVVLNNVGSVARERRDWALANTVYRESLQISSELASWLGTPGHWHDVGISLWQLAAVEVGSGHAEVSCRLLREALPIFESLARILQTPQAQSELEMVRNQLVEQGCSG